MRKAVSPGCPRRGRHGRRCHRRVVVGRGPGGTGEIVEAVREVDCAVPNLSRAADCRHSMVRRRRRHGDPWPRGSRRHGRVEPRDHLGNDQRGSDRRRGRGRRLRRQRGRRRGRRWPVERRYDRGRDQRGNDRRGCGGDGLDGGDGDAGVSNARTITTLTNSRSVAGGRSLCGGYGNGARASRTPAAPRSGARQPGQGHDLRRGRAQRRDDRRLDNGGAISSRSGGGAGAGRDDQRAGQHRVDRERKQRRRRRSRCVERRAGRSL